jgi:hypothetical protein
MTTLQTFLLAGSMAAMFLISVVVIIIAGQCHTVIELLEREDERQRRLLAFLRARNYDQK